VGQRAHWIAEEALSWRHGHSKCLSDGNNVDAIAVLGGLIQPGDVVLIKGSRAPEWRLLWTHCRDLSLPKWGSYEPAEPNDICADLGDHLVLTRVVWGRPLINLLRRKKIGKQIRIEGPTATKARGTPTMGGVLFLVPGIHCHSGA